MKTRLVSVCVLVVGLALALSWAVIAQQPPENGGASSGERVREKTAAAISLGQPGTSFRYGETFGVTEQAYPADVQHLNGPNGLFVDGSDNLYVAEELGSRILKYRTSDGANLLSIGTAGMRYTDARRTGDYVFTWLEDVALDGSGNIWVGDVFRVVQYDVSGNFLQQLPPDDPWNSGQDETHFNGPCSIAFDSAGRMYVSDRGNHRIQVYTLTLGSPVYSATIGVTGIPGVDDAHFNSPNHIAIDSSNRLYVPDMYNHRIQRCTYAAGWTCTTFHGTGSAGSDPNQLNTPCGVGTDGSDNVYIADMDNNRVKKCTSAGSCSTFATGPAWMHDVAVDSSGNVYASAWLDSTIRKYNSSGVFQGVFAGTTGVPYAADTARLNTPWGIAVTAADGSIYVTEDRGVRLVKLNAAGIQQWTVGQAGVAGSDNAHFGGGWTYLEGNPAVDAAERIYVPDTGNDRVQIFNSGGIYLTTFGSSGDGNYQFDCPAGVAVNSANGYIYVTDRCNQRIMVYDSGRVYKARLGVTGVSGSDNTHFNNPRGVAVGADGSVFVADGDNDRVQKCTLSGSSGTCTTFAGVTGECGDDFDHLCGPHSVAVDGSGQVYVADKWNDRVQVFDSSGAYLATIGGAWGSNTGQIRGPSGIAVDSAGNVYVTDSDNHRIQKFAPGVPGWQQVNINGFGDMDTWGINRMSVFGNYLYASTYNLDAGGEVWRTANDTDWSQVNLDGFGIVSNTSTTVGEALNGYLYVGTENPTMGGEIWRCSTCDGTDWTRVISGGFGDTNNGKVERIVVFSNTLYAAANNSSTGVEVWRSSTGDPGSWAQCNTDGFGDVNNSGLWATAVFSNYLYVATAQWGNTHTGVEVWRCAACDGTDWSQVNTDGFGNPENRSPWLEPFNGYLYVASFNFGAGVQVWRCATCDGSDWERVVDDGFGDGNNPGSNLMLGLDDYFYVCTSNSVTGAEVWRTADGTSWSQVNLDGFGDSNNVDIWSGAVFNNRLFLGTRNDGGWQDPANGGEVWMLLRQVYLPLAVRSY